MAPWIPGEMAQREVGRGAGSMDGTVGNRPSPGPRPPSCTESSGPSSEELTSACPARSRCVLVGLSASDSRGNPRASGRLVRSDGPGDLALCPSEAANQRRQPEGLGQERGKGREEGRDPTAAEVSVLGGLGEWGGSEEEGEGGWHRHDARGGDKKETSNTYPDAMSRAVCLSWCSLLWCCGSFGKRFGLSGVCRVQSVRLTVDDGGSKIEGKDCCWVVVVRGRRCGVAVPSLTAPSPGTEASCARARW